ncbi:nucleic acid-binding, OB-fold-like protein [Wolffia australiana]
MATSLRPPKKTLSLSFSSSSSSSSLPSIPRAHFPSPLLSFRNSPLLSWQRRLHHQHKPRRQTHLPKAAYAPDELPVDEEFLAKFAPKENESEEEARRRNWVDRGWAPWEEILTPEGDFARKSLNEGEEVPLESPDAIEAFKMLSPAYRRTKGIDGDAYTIWQIENQLGKNPVENLGDTLWDGPLVLRTVPPRDWPPRGWSVDEKELEFIREAHKLEWERVDLEKESSTDIDSACLERYKVFLKQYKEWAAANRERLEEEAYQLDQDYYPGRRKRGEDYNEEMLELPFFYPGQICVGKVKTVHLHQGAFVDVGCVHDGWVPIKGNDWYWIRHHIKVGMQVIVEILAKRDPYRFRFPLEMRFVDPNIDHLIFNRFDYPPIFHREEDKNPEELWRDAGRPPIPRKNPGIKIEEQPLLSNHPYVDKLWQYHVSEQMILDDMEKNPEKYKDKKYMESFFNAPYDEENSVEHTQAYYKNSWIPKTILKTNVRELDLDAALEERQLNNKLKKEAKERGEEYEVGKLRRMVEMDEYDLLHWRRSLEEREALIRDISARRAVDLPVEEPGRYVDESVLGKDRYDPTNPLYRYDYWGEPKNSEKSKQERLTEDHNRAIVGKSKLWYDMSYEEALTHRSKTRQPDHPAQDDNDTEDDDGYGDDLDFDYSIFGDSGATIGKPFVNGTESPGVSDDGIFED